MWSSRALLRRIARSLVYPLIEGATLALLVARKRALTLTNRQQLLQARPLQPTGNDRILIVAAHPDDETIGCFGAITLHRHAGDTVKVVMVTDGSGSRAGGHSPTSMAALRREEVAQLRSLLPGVQIEQLDLVEGHWRDDDLMPALRRTIEAFHPNVIYTPSCVDFHPEHIKVGKVLARALGEIPQSRQPTIRAYEMQVPLGIELINLYSTLGTHLAAKKRAIATYRSQRGALDLWRRQARYLGALYSAQNGAEAFWEMTTEGYQRIMDYATWDWRTTPFRSLSGRPFGDLQAHTKGKRARLVLRNLAHGYRRA